MDKYHDKAKYQEALENQAINLSYWSFWSYKFTSEN